MLTSDALASDVVGATRFKHDPNDAIRKSAPCSAPEHAKPYTNRRGLRGLCPHSLLCKRPRCIFVPERR
jgi:hypothetical protein